MRGRPGLITRYRTDAAIFSTWSKRAWFLAFAGFVVLLGFAIPDDWALLGSLAGLAAVGALGLNVVTGYAGQVSLGHAFFLGLGAYTAAVLGGEAAAFGPGSDVLAYGLDMAIWLPAAGLVAALAGALVAPLAFRVRGLYLAFVTLGLVFIGEYIFRASTRITGGSGVGRGGAQPVILGHDLSEDGEVLGVFLSNQQKFYFFALIVLLIFGILAKNLVRSRVGRAFSAVRDRDIAAAIMGISLRRTKLTAFVVSSFYAGIAGALIWSFLGFIEPSEFGLTLSVVYIAMILIGGAASIAGSIIGAVFITLLPRLVEPLAGAVPFIEGTTGGFLSVPQLEALLFGTLIILFLILEPLGLFGLWIRVRNYWKAWPFSY